MKFHKCIINIKIAHIKTESIYFIFIIFYLKNNLIFYYLLNNSIPY
jgi:hypothetical protein